MEAAQVNHHVAAQESIVIQQQATHQAHWERTVQATPETVVVEVPEAVEPTEVRVVQEPQETLEVLEATRDPTRCPQEDQRTTVQV